MTPYYQDDSVTIYHGDYREVHAWLSADVLVTDPPYGRAYQSNRSIYKGPSPAIAGDKGTAARDDALSSWLPRPALVFGSWQAPRPLNIRHLLVWDKGDCPGMGDLSLPFGNACEEVYVFGSGWTGKRRSNVLRVQTLGAADSRRPDHPTPKPIGLMELLIGYAPPGVIADPFMGSGSTLVAAKNLGRRAIGIEIEERYCEIAARRCAQDVLFAGAA